jgi:sentrin-specific protease 1
MEWLRPGIWLNDKIINFYFYLQGVENERMCMLLPNTKCNYFFKTQFMNLLMDVDNADGSLAGKYNYKTDKHWSQRVPGKDIFKLGKIFFPIYFSGMNWALDMIDMPKKKIYFYDSMGSGGMDFLKSLFQYIQDEHEEKNGESLPDIDQWEQLIANQPGTPTQQNGKFHLPLLSKSSNMVY